MSDSNLSPSTIEVIDRLEYIEVIDGDHLYYVNELPGVAINKMKSSLLPIYREYENPVGSIILHVDRRGMHYVLTGAISDGSIVWNEMTRPYYVVDFHLEDPSSKLTYLCELMEGGGLDGDKPLVRLTEDTFGQSRYTLYGDNSDILMIFDTRYEVDPGEVKGYLNAREVLDKDLYEAMFHTA